LENSPNFSFFPITFSWKNPGCSKRVPVLGNRSPETLGALTFQNPVGQSHGGRKTRGVPPLEEGSSTIRGEKKTLWPKKGAGAPYRGGE